jgi:hypothetical protein
LRRSIAAARLGCPLIVFVAPFSEDDLGKDVPVERNLFGNNFPHPEGLANPLDVLEEFRNFSADEVQKVFSIKLKGLLKSASP